MRLITATTMTVFGTLSKACTRNLTALSLLSVLLLPLGASANSPAIELESTIPAAQAELVRMTISKVSDLSAGMKLPTKVVVAMAPQDSRYEGAVTDLLGDKIMLTKMAFSLSPAAFQTLIAHEFTHLIVANNLHVPGASPSSDHRLREELIKLRARGDYSDNVLAAMHGHYAELLCDLMAVLVMSDAGAITKMLEEIIKLASADPELKKTIDHVFRDQPRELSVRDFRISHDDMRWASYTPSDMIYNRFNQIRAYLGSRWLTKLPPEKNATLFRETFQLLDQVFVGQKLDYIVSIQGLPAANQMLIQGLEQKLAPLFP